MRHVSLTGLLVFFGASFILYFVLNSVDHSMRLRRLPGTKATKVKGTLPFGKPRPGVLRVLQEVCNAHVYSQGSILLGTRSMLP